MKFVDVMQYERQRGDERMKTEGKSVIGFCSYNMAETGQVAKTLHCQAATDTDHLPVVVCYENHATDARLCRTDVAPTGGGSWNGCYGNKNPLILTELQ